MRTFERADIGEKVVRDSIARQIDHVTKSLSSQLSEASLIHPSSVYAEIADSITQRIRQLAF